jgi:hypothetical protein
MIEIIVFPKKCPHGEPMRVVKKGLRSQHWWYEAIDCKTCDAEDQAEQEEQDKKTKAFLERLRARKQKDAPFV